MRISNSALLESCPSNRTSSLVILQLFTQWEATLSYINKTKELQQLTNSFLQACRQKKELARGRTKCGMDGPRILGTEGLLSSAVSMPELKTEEGYSADIVRTYFPGDICPHNVGTISAQYPHNVSTISAQHLTKDICRHNDRTISAQCPYNVRTISFFGFQLRKQNWYFFYFLMS